MPADAKHSRAKTKEPGDTKDSGQLSRGKEKKRGESGSNKANQDDLGVPSGSARRHGPHAAGARNEEAKQHPLGPESSGGSSSNQHTFKLPPIDPTIYIQFLDQLLFGHNRKAAIM